jgi:hypothetical protein
MDPELYRTSIARRLRLQIFEEDQWCPRCGQIMDRFGDHALVCPFNGNRTVRHNRFRNIVYEESLLAAMNTTNKRLTSSQTALAATELDPREGAAQRIFGGKMGLGGRGSPGTLPSFQA